MSVREKIRPIKHLQNKYFVCVLERPQDINNVASAIRNISAFGVEKLYVVGSKGVIEDFNASRRSKHLTKLSVGANKWVFVKHFETTAECLAHLRKNRFTVAVTSSHVKGQENVYLYEGTFTQSRLAVWFGNESKGISDEAVGGADFCIQIPMGGIVESLNLGTSTGIVLSYISYQRLGYVFTHRKVRFKSKGAAERKLRSWHDFLNPHRD